MGLPETVMDQTVTPEWLNAKLGITTIESINIQPIGDKRGFTDMVYRIHLTHKNDSNAIRLTERQLDTIVMKVADASIGHRTAFEPLHSREVRFYREIAPLLNLDTIPKCYHAYFDKDKLRGNILLEDAGRPIHKGGLQRDGFETVTASQAKRTMTELGRLHGTSLTRMSEIPTDMLRPLERDSEEIRKAFPVFARTWRPLLGEEVLGRYERAVDAYETKWLAQKDGFVQGLVHGDYRLGNVIFCREEGPEYTSQDQVGQDLDAANSFDEGIKASVAQRHLAKERLGEDAGQLSQSATFNGSVKEPAAVGTLESAGGNAPVTGNSSLLSEKLHEINGNYPSKSGDAGIRAQQNLGSAASSKLEDEVSKLRFRHVDWQTVSRGPALFDVAYFLAMSMHSDTRRACEFDLVYAWYTACREAAGPHFPADLNIARCVHEIGMACIAVVLVSVTTLDKFQASEVPMRAVAEKLKIVSEILIDWRSLDEQCSLSLSLVLRTQANRYKP
ncbi:hypothetical protein K432DRAFT_387372 [Lepidopterella palustris CBS 459.81]|uniref:Aminoglycoside phosphotransferase domain-containing protein n=1 Tax=Lepidopterella palustris CBS 459.81 TaxID=1314670 RepID=A0A8E2J8Q0_9PEZI|nr:hypothetical protein K432DRAFT_387372 [Lepidopterella palustris CBS 459.81]